MAADVRVSSIHIRLRHPVHEAGLTNVFDAATQEWIVDADGVAVALPEKGPFTPQQLASKGLTLPVIMDQAIQTAIADRVAALAEATGANAERNVARTERDAARAELATANSRIAELEALLAQAQGQAVEAIQARNTAIIKARDSAGVMEKLQEEVETLRAAKPEADQLATAATPKGKAK